jgi:uncharacterized repeat protein (TIGR01451 family)
VFIPSPSRWRTAFAFALIISSFGVSAQMATPAVRPSAIRMIDARVNAKEEFRSAMDARPGLQTQGTQRATAALKSMTDALTMSRRTMPGLDVRFSGITGAPTLVRNSRGTLTKASSANNEAIARTFLRTYGDLYGLSSADLSDLVVVGDSKGGRSGLRMLRMEQQINGRPVFQSETRFLIDREGRVVSTAGAMVPHARNLAPIINDGALLSASQAVSRLLAAEGRTADAALFTPAAANPGNTGAWKQLDETDEYVAGTIFAREVLFPIAPGALVPAWAVVVFTTGEADWYAIVDAEHGHLLWRKNIRASVSSHNARFRVFVQADGTTPADNPAPSSPTLVTPGSGTQFAYLPPTIVAMHTAMDPLASPNGWIDDCPGGVCTANETQTLGNNALVCLDRTGGGNANICDTDANSVLDGNGRPTGNTDANGRDRDFLGTTVRDFESTFTPPPQVTASDAEVGQTATGTGGALNVFRRGAVTHLFYVTNWYHDKLFALGFDEGSANFQQTNFSGMGLGGDRVLGDAQDGSGTNNANFATPPDGVSGRMQMYRFTGPTIDRDGGLDAEIVLHELTHGTSNRLVGNAAGLNWDSAAGMGEGWSDFYALSLLNNTNADDPDAPYASGGYSTYKLIGGYLDNYLYGIRRFPYSTDNTVNPMTWADVDDTTNSLTGGIAASPVDFNGAGGMEVHNSGEIWALTLWEVRSRIIADPAGANGDVPTGNQTTLQLVTDALKMTPIDPTFVEARDAILDADCATNSCVNESSIWGGFADRGLGWGAQTPYNASFGYTASHMGVRESFSVPYLDVVSNSNVAIDDSASNNNGSIDPGEAIRLTVSLFNPWRAASRSVASATGVLTTTTPGVAIYDNSATWGAIAPQSTTAASDVFLIALDTTVACGSSIEFTLTTTSSLGVTSTTFTVRVGNANGTDAVVTYTKDTTPNLAIPDGQPLAVNDSLTVTDDFEIADLDFRIDSVSHSFTGDLTFMLRSPGGIGVDQISLIGGLTDGGPGDNMTNMVVDDDVANNAANDMVQITSAAAPYTKSWLPVFNAPWTTLAGFPPSDPVGTLSRLDGTSTKGTWTVAASDQFAADTGTLNAWSILVTPVHFDCTAFAPSAAVAGTKTVAGTFEVGGTVTYTVTLTNNGTDNQGDNSGDEYTDVLPASLTLVSANATSGSASANVGTNTVTWNGSLAPLGGTVTITITATINAGTQGTTIASQGSIQYDANNDNTNEASAVTDDPGLGGATDPTSFAVLVAQLTGTKSVSGTYSAGGTITYTITLTNSGTAASPDNAGNEFTDVLPSSLTLVSANATSGTPAANVGTNTVTWNGSIPAAGSVTITITATINAGTQGQTISNQGQFAFDADLNGSNEANGVTDDPGQGGASDTTSLVVGASQVGTTKTVSGTFTPGSVVTYTVTLSNTGNSAQGDNPGNEFVDVLPSTLTLVSANATSGTATATIGTNTVTWNGTIAAAGSVTITITATINAATAPGTVVSNQGTANYDGDVNGTNETAVLTDDPSVGGATDPTSFTVSGARVTGTKTASGTYVVGGTVTYTIVLTNTGNLATPDNAGNEFTDVLPPTLTLVSATATSGTALATIGTNTVTWNGGLAPSASVTITITATINSGAAGMSVVNQGTISYDTNNDGTNDGTGSTDDPSVGGTADPTTITVAALAVDPVPTASEWALLLLGLGIAIVAVRLLKY